MTLKRAKVLRDLIQAETGWYCRVPLNPGTNGYVARIMLADGPKDFRSERAFRVYLRASREATEAILKFARDHGLTERGYTDTRSPIERMVDDACKISKPVKAKGVSPS